MVDNLSRRIQSLTYMVTEEVHSGMGYNHFEFAIDRIVAEIATLPEGVRATFEMDLYSRMVEQNQYVQELNRAHDLNVLTMPRWNALSPVAEHANLGTLRNLVRAKSVRSTQALDRELAKTKGQQSWSKFASHWIEAYTTRHGGAPKPSDLVHKLMQALPAKHHQAALATCANTMRDPAAPLNDFIEFFKKFDELLGSPNDTLPANPNAMQVDQLGVMQLAVAHETQQRAAVAEATARGDFALVAAIRAALTCFYCHLPGHFACECPKKKDEDEKAQRDAQREKDKALAKQAAKFQRKGKRLGQSLDSKTSVPAPKIHILPSQPNYSRPSSVHPSSPPTALRCQSEGSIGGIPIPLTYDPGSYLVCANTSHPAMQVPLKPATNLTFSHAGGTPLTCAGFADVTLTLCPGVTRPVRVYAINELAVECLLGAQVLYAERCAYDLTSHASWWQIGNDTIPVTTLRGNAAAAVQSVRCCLTPVTDGPSLSKRHWRRVQQRQRKRQHSPPSHPPTSPPPVQATAKTNEELMDDLREEFRHRDVPLTDYPPPPPLVDLFPPNTSDVDPGANSVHSALKWFEEGERRPNVVRPKRGKANVVFDPSLPKDWKKAMEALVAEFRDVFANDDSEIGVTGSAEMRIFTTSDQPVTSGRNRRLPYAQFQAALSEVEKLLAMSWIQPSQSAWASPVVMVPKDDESWRFCLDFREGNRITMADGSPVPHMMDELSKLSGCTRFDKLDFAKFFHQAPLDETSKKKTAFFIGNRQFEYTVCPFGLKNAPGAMVRLLSGFVLADLAEEKMAVYFDDCLSGYDTLDDSLRRSRLIFERLRKHGLVMRSDKCIFGAPQIKALGFVVDQKGIRPDPSKLDAVRGFPQPTTPKELRSFLGLINFNGFFVDRLQEILAPLNAATSQSPQRFHLDAACVQAFKKAKEVFSAELLLRLPDQLRPFFLTTDGSAKGISGVLSQQDEVGVDWPVSFFSRALKESHSSRSARDLELYALLESCKHFREYLIARPFTWRTDHKPLQHEQRNPSRTVTRWINELKEYDFTTEYIRGANNRAADALSRCPLPDDASVFAVRAIHETLSRVFVAKKDEGRNHASAQTMLREISKDYHWEYMAADIKRKAGGCEVCQRTQLKRGQRLADVETDTPSGPWQSICADLCGLDGYGDQGYMLLTADRFSREINATIIPSKEAPVVEQALTDMLFRRHGIVGGEIVTDGGTEFVSLQAYSEANGFYWKRTSRGNPRSNGLCERANLTVLQMLRKNLLSGEILPLLQSERTKVPGRPLANALRDALFIYNNKVHSATGVTPYQLAYLRTPVVPIQVLEQRPKRQINVKSQAYASMQQRAAQLASLQREALDRMRTEKHRRAERAAAKLPPAVRFKVGELVMTDAEPKQKLSPGLSPPFRIIQVLAGNTYRLQAVDDFRKESIIRTHHKIVRFHSPDLDLQTPGTLPTPVPPKKRGRKPKTTQAAPHGSGGSRQAPSAEQLPTVTEDDEQIDEEDSSDLDQDMGGGPAGDLDPAEETLFEPDPPQPTPGPDPMRTPAPKRPWRSPSSGSISSSSNGPTPFKQPRFGDPPGLYIEDTGGV